MIEVFPNLFIGGAEDFTTARKIDGKDWFIVSAAKEPWHRDALGYVERAAPKDDDEYLIAKRPNNLILNLVDAADPAYIPDEIITTALDTIHEQLQAGSKVLVHCNQGLSRSPTIALLYLRRHDDSYANLDFQEGVEKFKLMHPFYKPSAGIAAYAEEHW